MTTKNTTLDLELRAVLIIPHDDARPHLTPTINELLDSLVATWNVGIEVVPTNREKRNGNLRIGEVKVLSKTCPCCEQPISTIKGPG